LVLRPVLEREAKNFRRGEEWVDWLFRKNLVNIFVLNDSVIARFYDEVANEGSTYRLGFGGTFFPSLRASESAIAIACFRLVTFFPLRPLFSFPSCISRISRSTSFPTEGLYLRVDSFLIDFLAEVFFAALFAGAFLAAFFVAFLVAMPFLLAVREQAPRLALH
jgi:hypothetical protein